MPKPQVVPRAGGEREIRVVLTRLSHGKDMLSMQRRCGISLCHCQRQDFPCGSLQVQFACMNGRNTLARCDSCKEPLGGKPFIEKDDKFFCEDDYYAAFK